MPLTPPAAPAPNQHPFALAPIPQSTPQTPVAPPSQTDAQEWEAIASQAQAAIDKGGVEGDVPSEGEVVTTQKPVTKPVKASQWASMAKKEASIRQQQEQLKKDREEVATFKEFASKAGTVEGMFAMMAHYGISAQQLVEMLKTGIQPPKPEDKAAKALQEVEGIKKTLTDRETQAKQQQQAQLKEEVEGEIAQAISSDPARYSLLTEHPERQADVFKVLEKAFAATGKEMSYQDACDLVEKTIDYEYTKRIGKFGYKSKFAPGAKPPPRAPSPTLSHAAPVQTPSNEDTDDLSILGERAWKTYQEKMREENGE